jgi:hypothetical protein
VKCGLVARTRILTVLEQRVADATTIAIDTAQSYEAVFHHLRLLELEGTVKRRGKRPYSWVLTGFGQKRLA